MCYHGPVNPTLLTVGAFRFFFFSREEDRPHVHVSSSDGEAKFWLEPTISLAHYEGFRKAQLRKLQLLVEEHYEEFIETWRTHFKV